MRPRIQGKACSKPSRVTSYLPYSLFDANNAKLIYLEECEVKEIWQSTKLIRSLVRTLKDKQQAKIIGLCVNGFILPFFKSDYYYIEQFIALPVLQLQYHWTPNLGWRLWCRPRVSNSPRHMMCHQWWDSNM